MAKDYGVPLSYTIELRDTGRFGFLLPEIQVRLLKIYMLYFFFFFLLFFFFFSYFKPLYCSLGFLW